MDIPAITAGLIDLSQFDIPLVANGFKKYTATKVNAIEGTIAVLFFNDDDAFVNLVFSAFEQTLMPFGNLFGACINKPFIVPSHNHDYAS